MPSAPEVSTIRDYIGVIRLWHFSKMEVVHLETRLFQPYTPIILEAMDTETSKMKRRRSPSVDSSSSEGSDSCIEGNLRSPSPPPKYHRGTLPEHLPFTCNLPPTCSQPETSTAYATNVELQRHQEIFHRWVCHVPIKDRTQAVSPDGIPESFVSRRGKDWEWKECGKAFPDEWMLSLVS